MKPPDSIQNGPRNIMVFILVIATAAGFCTMSYEVLWFRILKYFVDTSIQSFGIMLTTFLFGLMAGGFLFSRLIDSRRDKFLLLGFMEIGIGILSVFSIPMISQANNLIAGLNTLLGTNWGQEIFIRFMVFSIVMLPTAILAGGAFPVFTMIYSENSNAIGKSIGEVFSFNTIGGAIGSFASGFLLIPLLGVENSIFAICMVNVFIGLSCWFVGSRLRTKNKIIVSVIALVVAVFLVVEIPQNSFVNIYNAKYPPPDNEMLYCKETINGTTTVFQNTRQNMQRYLLIDGIGEVSTDYFSLRAFRFLDMLPFLYLPEAQNALVVTFGSGIVAGSIGSMPGIKHVDCVEICDKAFDAARYFSYDNHDVLHNKKINFIVNDGRNFVFTTKNRYDIISADATHPTSSDSWILYTREFYDLCKSKLVDNGVMCQWIPLHGIREEDYKKLLNTFRTVFPYAALYYSGGRKNTGHTMLLGSKKPMQIDFNAAQKLFEDKQIKDDLEQVNIGSAYDLLHSFIMDQDGIKAYAGNSPINTDDRPQIVFSKFKTQDASVTGIGSIVMFRESVFPSIINIDNAQVLNVRQRINNDYEAETFSIQGQILEFEEFMKRAKQDFGTSQVQILNNLQMSKATFEKAILSYQKSLEIDSNDFHTRYLLEHAMFEYNGLMSYLEKTTGP